jgi:hypothetical protein
VENFVEDESNRFILDINIVQSKSSWSFAHVCLPVLAEFRTCYV